MALALRLADLRVGAVTGQARSTFLLDRGAVSPLLAVNALSATAWLCDTPWTGLKIRLESAEPLGGTDL